MGSVLMKIEVMMHIVTNWPMGCLLLLLMMPHVIVSNGTVTVYLIMSLYLHVHRMRMAAFSQSLMGVRELIQLIILITIYTIISFIC